MTDFPRLIEHAFPLEQTSLDSVHEKNVRHGHISTLHIWPARRPLAACRAALIATLLPDPSAEPRPKGMSDEQWQKELAKRRQQLCEKIGGKVVTKTRKKPTSDGSSAEREVRETEGGILHWGREAENADTLDWFRQEIRKAYGGRAPRVLDPFAGGGAIPLEAMRLGCEATAVDINPVAWFILKCTLEYPQKLAGQTRPLPEFILHNDGFMEEYFKKAKGYGKADVRAAIKRLHQQLNAKRKARAHEQESLAFADETDELQADLAWHVRAWGQWVLGRARRELAEYYPTYADFEPLKKDVTPYEHQPMRLVPLADDGTPDIDALNAEFTEEYLADKRNPRWVAKPTVAYLWARTVTCKNCRATIPLLKTRWLCKKAKKRVLLTMEPNADGTGVVFDVETGVPSKGGNAAQKREHDKRIGAGTMSRAGVKCPCCGTIMTMEDVRVVSNAAGLGATMTAVVVSAPIGQEFRPPTEHERTAAEVAPEALQACYSTVEHGIPDDPLPSKEALGIRVPLYGFTKWSDLYTARQLLALGMLTKATQDARSAGRDLIVDDFLAEAVHAYLSIAVDRLADRLATLCTWDQGYTKINHVFHRYALPITWDFCEGNPLSDTTGNYGAGIEWASRFVDHALLAAKEGEPPIAECKSAITVGGSKQFDIVITDPPYYDAIPYSDLMDFFYVWLRRSASGLNSDFTSFFRNNLAPKWDSDTHDGELIDEKSRHGGDSAVSKQAYEDGMYRAFLAVHAVLSPEGRFVIVFAHKQPDAWETLVSAIIRAGFVVDGSWPIQTEMSTGLRNFGRASLASSVWLVCKKRPATAPPGWDNHILDEMRANIAIKLRAFWDAGIRGPDFVWAATGPAMEAYSRHPVVKKANAPGQTMKVGEFLNHVRRMVVDYVVGQVLTGEQGSDLAAADRLDEVSAYYLLHRHDFGMDEAPVGACILYATACGLSDSDLSRTWDILAGTGGGRAAEPDEGDDDSDDSDQDAAPAEDSGGGSKVKLKPWSRRTGKSMGHEAPEGKAVPLIDRIHRVMHLWKAGDVQKVDEYLDDHALRRNELFKRMVQSLIELSANTERSTLESISNHIGAKGAVREDKQQQIAFEGE